MLKLLLLSLIGNNIQNCGKIFWKVYVWDPYRVIAWKIHKSERNPMKEKLPKRNEVPVELTWRLNDIYETTEEWEADLNGSLALAKELSSFEGRVTESPENLLLVLDLYEKCLMKLYSCDTYASMRHDQDTADAENQKLVSRIQTCAVQIDEMVSFLEPEILGMDPADLDRYYEALPGLRKYEVTIREIVRLRNHSLAKELEKLLASAGEMAQTPSNGFGMLMNADLRFPSVRDGEGNEVQLTNGRFVPVQMSGDRTLRKNAFEAFYGRYSEFKNTWAALYDGQVKQQIFYAKARKYPSTFAAAVTKNNVDPAVCDNLIESVHRNMDKMHRYVRLRRRMLGVEELHMYDVYAPMVSDFDASVTYEEAQEMVLAALRPLGEGYLEVVREAFRERWIDVPENEGKRSGAYSTGVYGVHPYMLLNWNGTLDDVFTLIHEMGHSMHTWYSSKNQTFLNSHYKIFVAEVASTTNEILLLEYLLGKAEDRKERAYLINHYLESFKGTLFRQTMFEEFERKTNAMAEKGIPLTADTLCETYIGLNREYFGEDMVSDPLIAYEWCRIPHFYYNFYVYQYATSFAASVAIAHRILSEGDCAAAPYLEFLKSGCTDDPVSLLKIAGVDLSTGRPVDEAIAVFGEAVSEMERLVETEDK